MKHVKFWSITIGLIIVISGGGIYFHYHHQNINNTRYQQVFSAGKKAAQKAQYSLASRDFAQAYTLKQTPEAHDYHAQTVSMQLANNNVDKYKFKTAINNATAALNKPHGYSVINQQAQSLISTLTIVKDNCEDEIKPLLKQAHANEVAQDKAQALADYQKIINLPYIKERYYAKYLKQAENGIKRNQGQIKAANTETVQHSPTKKQANASSSSSSSLQKATSTDNPAGKIGAGKMGDHTVNGKTVQADQLSAIKKQLNSLGYNADAWSPQDMIDLYRHAATNGHTSPDAITKDDIQSYLK